eukprot:m.60630 g.60630  ORF g.60630 m.60630 type:complete len:525 (-) comp11832_c0_seq1:2298-3872(-)
MQGQASMEKIVEAIRELVEDQSTTVSYKHLALKLDLPVNKAKQALTQYVDQCKVKETAVDTTVCVIGRDKSSNLKILIVPEQELAAVKSSLEAVTSEHVYSVQKSPLKNAEVALYAADYDIQCDRLDAIPKLSQIKGDGVVQSASFKAPKLASIDAPASVQTRISSSSSAAATLNATTPAAFLKKKSSTSKSSSSKPASKSEKAAASKKKKRDAFFANVKPSTSSSTSDETLQTKQAAADETEVDAVIQASKAKLKEKSAVGMLDSDSEDEDGGEDMTKTNAKQSATPATVQRMTSDDMAAAAAMLDADETESDEEDGEEEQKSQEQRPTKQQSKKVAKKEQIPTASTEKHKNDGKPQPKQQPAMEVAVDETTKQKQQKSTAKAKSKAQETSPQSPTKKGTKASAKKAAAARAAVAAPMTEQETPEFNEDDVDVPTTRTVNVKERKTYVNDKGYMVTEEVMVEKVVDLTEQERKTLRAKLIATAKRKHDAKYGAPAAKTSKAAKGGSKGKAKGKQASLMSFFKK